MSQLSETLKGLATFGGCPHQLEYIGAHAGGGGQVGRCTRCRCRVTSWPGGVHYDEIVAARDRGAVQAGKGRRGR